MRGATCGWRREVFHCLQLTQIFRNSRSLCTIPLQIPSLMPLEMRKVQLWGARAWEVPRKLPKPALPSRRGVGDNVGKRVLTNIVGFHLPPVG